MLKRTEAASLQRSPGAVESPGAGRSAAVTGELPDRLEIDDCARRDVAEVVDAGRREARYLGRMLPILQPDRH